MSVASFANARPKESLTGHVDVLVVGAGISGLGLGHYLVKDRPGTTFAIVDSRDAIGGTWDLFRYPGIRSDSDLHTFGYEFKPWTVRQRHRRRARDPQLPPRGDRGGRSGQAYLHAPQGDPSRFQHRDGALDGHPRARRQAVGRHRQLAVRRDRLLRLRRRIRTAVRGPGGFRRPDCAPAVLAGGSGLHRQAGRRHRQRRHRRHVDSGDGRQGRPHHHAAALAVLRDAAAAQGPDRQYLAKGVAAQGRLRRDAPVQHRQGPVHLQPLPAPTEAGPQDHP